MKLYNCVILKRLFLLLIFFILAFSVKAANYYWVGDANGNGDWNQVGNWKVDGMPASSIPSSADDVYLDRAGVYTITIRDNGSNCRNFTVLGGSPRLQGQGGVFFFLNVYGSVEIIPAIVSNSNTVRFFFKSNSTATYKANGSAWFHLSIDKDGGELIILDDLKYNYIDLHAGKLSFAPNITVNMDFFRSNNTGNRTLDLGNAYITVSKDWIYTGANSNLISGTSHIEMKRGDGVNFYVEAVASHMYNKFWFTNTLATTYNTANGVKYLSAKDVEYTVAYRTGTNLLKIEGVVGDSVRIGTLRTNSKVEFIYAVVDSAEYKTIYSTFVGNRSHFKNLYVEGSGAFQDLIKIDTLAISYGQYYSFNPKRKYEIFNEFRLLGTPCAGPITLESGTTNVNDMPELVKTSGSLDIPYGHIVNIKTSGGAAFNCAGYHNGNSVGWNFTDYVAAAKDLYWIGGGGYIHWNTPEAWSESSGGAPANCVPSQYDNVFFDNSSGLTTADKNVRLRSGIRAYSKDLSFIGDPEYLPRLDIRNSRGFEIYGSLLLNPGVSFANIQTIDSLRFLSSAPGNTITTNGQPLLRASFNNPTGGWMLMDDLTMASDHVITFNAGTLNTNSKNVGFHLFFSRFNGVRNLILGNSTITPTIGGNNQWGWYYNGTNMTLDAGTSLMNLANSSMISDTLLVYNRIKIDGTNQSTIQSIKAKKIELYQDPLNAGHIAFFRGYTIIDSLVSHRITEYYNTAKIKNAQLFHNGYFKSSHFFDTLMFGGNDRQFYFSQGTTQTIISKIGQFATVCDGSIYLTSMLNNDIALVPTATAKIQIPASETFQLNGAKIRWMEGLDGTFTASGEDAGNNVNWTFTPPVSKDIYWVGGSGDWHDQAHWSDTSSGAGGFCLPTAYDNVIFDLNSNLVPTDDFIVYAPNAKNASCRNMTWSGVQGAKKTLHIENSLIVYGSVDLQADVNYLVRYFKFWAYDNFAVETVKSNGAVITGYAIFGELNKEAYGSWKLLDKLNMGIGTMKINGTDNKLTGHVQVYGTFDTDGHDIFAYMYLGANKSNSYWRTSTVEIQYRYIENMANVNTNLLGINSATAKLYAEDATLNVNLQETQKKYICLYNSKLKKILLYNFSDHHEINLQGNFTVDYLDAQSTNFTYIRNNITAKRIDAHNGMRFENNATVDTFNVGMEDYYFGVSKIYDFGIIQDHPTKCSSHRVFYGQGANITIGERLSLANTDFSKVNASGTNAPFNVTGSDLGLNTGLNITEPNKTTLYLVANVTPVGGVGIVYWDDTTAWSPTSGGAPNGCFPGRWTNVIIDDNSYVGYPTTILQLRPGLQNIGSKCHNFTSTRTAKTQYYSDRNNASQSLYVYGSIDFNSTSELIPEYNNSPLYLMAETPQTLNINYLRGVVYFRGTGSWTLQRDLISDPIHDRSMYFRSGDLILNGYTLGATRLMEENTGTKSYSIDMNNSNIRANQFLLPLGVLKNTESANMYLNNRVYHACFRAKHGPNPYKFNKVFFDIVSHNRSSGGVFATIQTNFAADSLLLRNSSNNADVKMTIDSAIDVKVFKTMRLNTSTPAVHTLILQNNGNYGSFYSDVIYVDINGNNTFDTLDIAANGPTYTLKAGTTQTIRQAAYMSGSPCKFTTFRSNTLGSLANLVIPRPMTVDFDVFAHIRAGSYDGTPGNVLTAERNSTEETGTFTENITFINKPKTVIGLGDNLTACFRDFPYTISSAGFFAGTAATYEWRNSANQVVGREANLVITVPGKYSVKVDYDPLYTCNQADEVTILRGASITPVIVWDTLRPICHKDSLVLTIYNPVGSGYQYAIKDTADQSLIISQVSPVFDNVKAGTYYLVVDSANCFSSTRLVTIREPFRAGIADDIIISDTSTCYNTSVTLSPQAGIGLDSVFHWYYDAALTSPIAGVGADGVFTTPLLTAPTTYYVATSSDTVCMNLPGTAKAVNITIKALPTLSLENTTPASCGGSNGVVTVTTWSGVAPFEYSKDGIIWQALNVFSSLSVGAQNFWVKDANGCISLPEEIVLEGRVTNDPNARSYGDGPAIYGVAENKLVECIFLGSLDVAKIQAVAASSAMANTALNDDGITILEVGGYTNLSQAKFQLQANGDLVAKVKATNHHTSPGTISGWIDFDRNGIYDEAQATETILADTIDGEYTLTWHGAAALMKNGETYMRLRITTHPNYFDPVASQENGETEDYRLNFRLFDITKTVSQNNAKIGDTLQYTLSVTNFSIFDLDNIFLFDPLPADTKFIEADNGGASAVVNLGGTNVNAVTWPLFNLVAGANVTRTFKVVINEIPDNDTIFNTAYAKVNIDTIPSAIVKVKVEPLNAEDDCFAVLKNGIIPQAAISANDTDPLRLFVRDTILNVGGNTALGGSAVLNIAPKGTMEYRAGNNGGLDTVYYRIKTNKSKADAIAVIAVVELKSDDFSGCTNSTVKVEVKPINNVVFEWFTTDTVLITLGDFANINLGENDTVVIVRPIIGGCETDTYFAVPIRLLPALKLPDIRLQVCPYPVRNINLSSYLDSIREMNYVWTALYSAPAIIAGTNSTTGTIHTGSMPGTHQYTYNFSNKCGAGRAKLILHALTNENTMYPISDTVVFCIDMIDEVNLNQIIGLEASGNWDYSNTVNPDATLGTYVEQKLPGSNYSGAYIFDIASAYTDTPATYDYPGGYFGDTNAKMFTFEYTTAANCGPSQTREIVIIVTSKFITP